MISDSTNNLSIIVIQSEITTQKLSLARMQSSVEILQTTLTSPPTNIPNSTSSNTTSPSSQPTSVRVGKNIFFDEDFDNSTSQEDYAQNLLDSENYDCTHLGIPFTNVNVDKCQETFSLRNELAKKWKEKQNSHSENEAILLEKIEKEGLFTKKEMEKSTNQNPLIKQIQENQELSEEEKKKVLERIEAQQKRFKEIEKRDRKQKICRIRLVHPHITNEEALTALYMKPGGCDGNEEECILRFMKHSFLVQVRKYIATQNEQPEEKIVQCKEESYEEGSDEEDWKTAKKKRKRRTKKTKRQYSNKRLRLDEALQQHDKKDWSRARRRAFELLKTNENAYYYRFNAAGETQRNGPWTKKEKELFLKRLKEFDIYKHDTPQWGLFAKGIPGRVGYQCSSFYRQLIKRGEIKDPNYWVDEKGKVHCKLGKRKSKTKKKKKKKSRDDDDTIYADEVSDEDQVSTSVIPNTTPSQRPLTARVSERLAGPLPGFLDPITQEEVEQPTISPYGHVAGYKTWLKILSQEPKNVCPFTKQPLYKRDLVKLTFDNIDKYRGFIKNI